MMKLSSIRYETYLRPMDPNDVGSIKLSEVLGSASWNFTTRVQKLILSTAILFSVGAFLAGDWLYSAAVLRNGVRTLMAARTGVSAGSHTCRAPDSVRHHAFLPKCATVDRWGRDSYEVFTNNLGLRDKSIRQVPVADAKPRVLILGDSFTEGKSAWGDTYVGRIESHVPQYDFLNGGVESYSPSNYLNQARLLLAAGIELDEVLVFVDISDTQDEAAYYRDVGTGAVAGPSRERFTTSTYSTFRLFVSRNLLLTNSLFDVYERTLINRGHFSLSVGQGGNIFDLERSAWTYRKVSETDPFDAGYAPLGVRGGISKEEAKMTLLWKELAERHIPISVVVYPWPAQVLHDTSDSWQVRIWRDWCAGKCKRFISVFPIFLAVRDGCPRDQPGCWYLKDFIFGDVHYSSAGNALVANAVIESLEQTAPIKVPEVVRH